MFKLSYILIIHMTSSTSSLKRQHIIKSATTLFLEYGFHAVSMDKVAHAAPVSKATLYKYFSSKNDLLAAVIDDLCINLWQVMSEISMQPASIDETLKKIAMSFVDLIFSKQGLAIYRLIVSESKNVPELGEMLYATGPKKAFSQLEDYLATINKQAHVNIADVTFATDVFFSLLKGELHLQCLLGVKPLPSALEKEQHINKVITFFTQRWL